MEKNTQSPRIIMQMLEQKNRDSSLIFKSRSSCSFAPKSEVTGLFLKKYRPIDDSSFLPLNPLTMDNTGFRT